METKEIAEIKFECNDLGEEFTIKEYLKLILTTLWQEKECFNSKRPFGNSVWEYDIYQVLIKHKVIKGKLDKYGCVEDMDTKKADKIITDIIKNF